MTVVPVIGKSNDTLYNMACQSIKFLCKTITMAKILHYQVKQYKRTCKIDDKLVGYGRGSML